MPEEELVPAIAAEKKGAYISGNTLVSGYSVVTLCLYELVLTCILNLMRKFCTVTILLLCTLFLSAQRSLSGVFQTNFPVYGMFGQTLTLNCDSSVVMNFRGDLMNDNSFGRWSVRDNTLTLSFDSTKYPQQRYKGQMNYRIKGQRLYLFNLTKEQYEELKAKALQIAKDSGQIVKLPSYRWFKKHTGRAMKNHSGKTGRQYFKRIEVTDCRATANIHVSAMQAKYYL